MSSYTWPWQFGSLLWPLSGVLGLVPRPELIFGNRYLYIFCGRDACRGFKDQLSDTAYALLVAAKNVYK